MAYRLKLKEDLEAGVRRVLVGQCERVEARLAEPPDAARATHEARKSLKRIRALLRLVRSGIGDDVWRRENATVRDIARRLSPLRDRDVVHQMIARLERGANAPLAGALRSLRQVLTQARPETGAEDDRKAALHAVVADLASVRHRLGKIALEGDFDAIVEAGLARTHASGRDLVATCGRDPEVEQIHELRKVVQAHWRQMIVLASAWPAVMKERAVEAQAVSGLLGDALDFQLLAEAVVAAEAKGLLRRSCALIEAAIEPPRGLAEAEGLLRAERLFAVKPRRFAREIGHYWNVARSLKSGVLRPHPDKTSR